MKHVKFSSLSPGVWSFASSRLWLLQIVNNFLPEVFNLESLEYLLQVSKVVASMSGSRWFSYLPLFSCRPSSFPVFAFKSREVWDYGKAQVNLINKAIENFDWNELFSGQNIHNQIKLFNTTILNIFRNFIPNKVILCDDKESPWVNDEIRLLIKQKNSIL